MRVYLAGPMRSRPLFNFPVFHAAAAHFRAMGHEVFNPAERDIAEDGFDPACDEPESLLYYMQHDLPAVMASDAVAVLPGWEESQGARLEVHVARECGLLMLDAATGEPYRETALDEAKRLVYGGRRADYGHPRDDYGRTAALWSPILGIPVTPQQAVLCMIQVKVSRECNKPKRDNRVNGCGYFECLNRIEEDPRD